MVLSAISTASMASSAILAASVTPVGLPMTASQSQTWAGGASSMGGYIGRRFLAGITPFVRARGTSLYVYDRDRIPGRIKYQQLPSSNQESELRSSHASFHAHRLEWAAGQVKRRMELHSVAGRQAYEAARNELIAINEESRELAREMLADWEGSHPDNNYHERNLRIGDRAWDRWRREKKLLVKAEEVELRWQLAGYRDLMEVAQQGTRSPSKGQTNKFEEALRTYETSMTEYIDYDRRMSQDDPECRENRRKKMEEKTLVALRELHQTVQQIYRKIGHQGLEALGAPLTFHIKTQAKLIDQGSNGMTALEPFVEIVWNVRDAVKQAKTGKISKEELDHAAATRFALNLLSWQYGSFRIVHPANAPLFGHHRPAEAGLMDGLADFIHGENTVGQGSISHWSHTGAMDYAGMVGGLYLLGMNPASILAEEVFKRIPAMAGYLHMRGVYLKRPPKIASDAERERIMGEVYKAMEARVKEGMMLAMFGTGTRAIEYPLVGPYMDLNHPGALHMPGAFIPSRDMTGMHAKLAMNIDSGIHVFANNLHRGGVPVQDIPRSLGGFFSSDNNFHLARIGEEDGFVALAGYLPPESLIRAEDFPDRPSYDILQLNSAIIREMEKMAGRRADTGLAHI